MRYKQSSEIVSVFWKLKISEKVAKITQLYPMQLGANTEYKKITKNYRGKQKNKHSRQQLFTEKQQKHTV